MQRYCVVHSYNYLPIARIQSRQSGLNNRHNYIFNDYNDFMMLILTFRLLVAFGTISGNRYKKKHDQWSIPSGKPVLFNFN